MRSGRRKIAVLDEQIDRHAVLAAEALRETVHQFPHVRALHAQRAQVGDHPAQFVAFLLDRLLQAGQFRARPARASAAACGAGRRAESSGSAASAGFRRADRARCGCAPIPRPAPAGCASRTRFRAAAPRSRTICSSQRKSPAENRPRDAWGFTQQHAARRPPAALHGHRQQ